MGDELYLSAALRGCKYLSHCCFFLFAVSKRGPCYQDVMEPIIQPFVLRSIAIKWGITFKRLTHLCWSAESLEPEWSRNGNSIIYHYLWWNICYDIEVVYHINDWFGAEIILRRGTRYWSNKRGSLANGNHVIDYIWRHWDKRGCPTDSEQPLPSCLGNILHDAIF